MGRADPEVAADLKAAGADPPEARQRTDCHAVRRMRKRGTAAAALEKAALRSTVRLSAGPRIASVYRPLSSSDNANFFIKYLPFPY